MIKVQEEMLKHLQDPAWQKAQQQKKDDFGCQNVVVRLATDGTVTGSASCGKNVGQLELKGTAQYFAK
jgi:hypothetical protein